MQFLFCPNDRDQFATNLRRDNMSKNLNWDNTRGQDVVIVQTAFGEDAVDIIDEICKALSNIELYSNQYMEVMNGVWVRYVSASDKARNKGCPLNGEASRYTVFSCSSGGSTCKVYKPKDQSMISAFCDIPLEIHIEVGKETRIEGFIRKSEIETGFYHIVFPIGLSNGYINGNLCYKINEFILPITREMVEQKCVYVKSEIRPCIISNNKGLRLI